MKQFTRTTHFALLGIALLNTALLPQAAFAKPFPKKGYILKGEDSAEVGRRSSSLEGQRAALRMMARMMRWNPKNEKDYETGGYDVGWSFLDNKGKLHEAGMAYANANTNEYGRSEYSDDKFLTIFGDYYDIYASVTPKMFRRAAKYNGSLRDLLRYGATSATSYKVTSSIDGKEEN